MAYWLLGSVGYRENLLIPTLRTGKRQFCEISLPLLRSSRPVLPAQMSFFAELWIHQEPVTEHCLTYNRLGPGTGQVHRTG